MSTYLKRFVYASLVYLGLAALFGVLNGITDMGYIGLFAHSHFNLLGFMSMMIFGIGYFILPRFNGADLRFPRLVPVHFWLGNLSLVAMVLFRGLQVSSGEGVYTYLFALAAAVQVITIFMFIVNIWISLSLSGQPAAKPATTRSANPEPAPKETSNRTTVTSQSKISELIDAVPSVADVLVAAGLRSLAMPGHLDKVRQMGITVGMACKNHGLDVDNTILQIEREMSRHAIAPAESGAGPNSRPDHPEAIITTEMLIGHVIATYPATRAVFQKHFGDGCFDCPGQAYESIDMACRMHGIDTGTFIDQVNEALRRQLVNRS